MGLEPVPTKIGNIGCANDSSVYMQIHLEINGQPAQLTVTMSNIKAVEVCKTIEKASKQGREWAKTGIQPT